MQCEHAFGKKSLGMELLILFLQNYEKLDFKLIF